MKTMSTDVPDRQWVGRRITFFGKHYNLCEDQLVDDGGRIPAKAVAELIRHYLTLPLPIMGPPEDAWCSFRELRGGGPVTVNFANNTNKTITTTFGGGSVGP